MKKQKLFAVAMAAAMTLSMAACGETQTSNETTSTPAPTATTAPTATPAPTQAPVADPTATPVPEPQNVTIEGANINFEDGNMGFVAAYMQHATSADTELSIVDFNGSKALQVTNLNGKTPFLAIDVASLLGENAANVAGVELVMGISHPDGEFYSVAGKVMTWDADKKKEAEFGDWSVYMAKKNPKVTNITFPEGTVFSADGNSVMMLSLKEDNGVAKAGNATMYIDDIRFYDKDGNTITADTTVAFAEPEGFSGGGLDMTNLCAVTNPVEWAGSTASAGGWTQAGFAFTDEVKAALVPGAVIEVSYTSDTGNIWIVMNEAAVGWTRVGVGKADGSNTTTSYKNNSKTTAQITYEQIAQYCGEDVSTWGSGLQFESDGNWEVYSVKVGQAAPVYSLGSAVEWAGCTAAAGAWTQAGTAFTDEVKAALVPGSVLEIAYTSDTGHLWVVMNEAAVGWSRVGVGNYDGSNSPVLATCYDGKCYLTYEQIASICGEDITTWGSGLQFESDGAWEVFSVKVGTAAEMQMAADLVEWAGCTAAAGAWTQAGTAFTDEVKAALVPGSVLNIAYTSDTGHLWVVMNEAAVGWSRVGVGNYDGSNSPVLAACNNGLCQITYEQIASICGEDVSTWGSGLQFESDGAWEVYSVTVGETPAANK